MKKLGSVKRAVIACSLLCASTAAAANQWSPSAGVQVAKVDVEACSQDDCDGQVFVTFASKPLTTTCSQDASGYYKIGGNAESREALRAVALAAKLSGNPVQVGWNNAGGSTSCTSSGYPILRVIIML